MPDKLKLNPFARVRSPVKAEVESPFTGKKCVFLGDFFRPERLRWPILVILSLAISVTLFPHILSKSETYHLGEVAQQDIKASRDFLIENSELTEQNREKAVKGALSVYDFDSDASNLVPRIKEAFSFARENMDYPLEPEELGLIDTVILERAVKKILEDGRTEERFFAILEIPAEKALFERLAYHLFSSQVEEAVIGLMTSVLRKGVVGNRSMLMSQIGKGGIILHEIYTQKETTVSDLTRFYDPTGAADFIKAQKDALAKTISPPELVDISLRLALSLISPNLTFNQRETELRKEIARELVKTTYYQIKKGEMLVREGERIGPDHLLKLSADTRTPRRVEMLGKIAAMSILTGVLFVVIYLVESAGARSIRKDGRHLLFFSLTILATFLFTWTCNFVAEEVARGFTLIDSKALLYAMPVACGAMVISIFQGINLAVISSLIISVLASLITGGRIEFFVYFLISSLVAAHGVQNCTERGVLIKTGLRVGVIQIILSLSIEMIDGSFYTIQSVVASLSGFIGGILVGIIGTGILPLVEMSFRFTTDIKLLELSNLDQPLLRNLMVQAPGTYHHSVIISNMVEATAKAVDANPLLAKVSAYYHDIGKMKKPLYFIENQMGGENKHEKLAPSMSSLILISHVKDGFELAKKHKLGREIADVIQQHHGTSLISFFYQKAKERTFTKGGKTIEVEEEDFRYPGPKPQTKEAGLVMLADMVEAASRSVVDPTSSRIKGMVQKIINNAFSDGQLNECELTLKDLNEIAKSFNKTLSGIFHQRIEYPETTTRSSKTSANGHTDHISTEITRSKKSDDKAESPEGLKRLGL
ncbi:MAG: HDIG domain-containing protein [Deltaproteobacteria bacterium]|nr:HDIG domain-containing protein [Deltaproteobacteria bacterium]